MKKRQPVLIELQAEDLEILFAENSKQLDEVLEQSYCPSCQKARPIADHYSIYLDALNDVLIVGTCSTCRQPLQRQLDLGQNKESSAVANHLRYIKKHYTSS